MENVRHPQVDPVLDAEQLGRAGAARAEHAERVGLVDHQARAVAAAELGDLGQRRDVALHREDAVDDDEDAAAVRCGAARACCSSRSRRLWRNGAQLGAREDAAVEDRGVVARVGDRPCRPGPRIVPSAPRFAWWPVVNTSASSVPEPVGELALELEVQVGRAVQEAASRSARCRSGAARRSAPCLTRSSPVSPR